MLLVVSLFWPGCRSAPAPVDRFYRIELPSPEAVRAMPAIDGVLLVDRLQVEALTGGRPLIYRASRDSVEILRRPYAVWSDAPTLMIQHVIADQLRAAGVADRVVLPSERAESDVILRGRLVQLEHVPRERIAFFEIELWLEYEGERSGESGWFGRFRYEEAMADGTPGAAVEAYRRSLARFCGELILALGSDEVR